MLPVINLTHCDEENCKTITIHILHTDKSVNLDVVAELFVYTFHSFKSGHANTNSSFNPFTTEVRFYVIQHIKTASVVKGLNDE